MARGEKHVRTMACAREFSLQSKTTRIVANISALPMTTENSNPNPQPGSKNFYTGAAGRAYHEQKRGVPDEAVSWIAQLRAEKIQPWVKKEDVVFEYGVGSGWNLSALTCNR